ncbi:unnamed protein product [Macrosiphum euphorbiae]|uniref:Secreted protein n=1 Tax=Macrosiphum euphorbiae TaxID=13131 RepID=A0AAV0W0F8_9HEMI|nr:unnamed protein product [Macrosiphum euphorbiae]
MRRQRHVTTCSLVLMGRAGTAAFHNGGGGRMRRYYNCLLLLWYCDFSECAATTDNVSSLPYGATLLEQYAPGPYRYHYVHRTDGAGGQFLKS